MCDSKVGAVLRYKIKVKNETNTVKENIKRMSDTDRLCGVPQRKRQRSAAYQTSAWHGAGTAVQTDGIAQQEQHRQNIVTNVCGLQADKTKKETDGSARRRECANPHERQQPQPSSHSEPGCRENPTRR